MSRSTTITLMQTLGVVTLGSAVLTDYYDAIVKELGALSLLTNAAAVRAVADQREYVKPSGAITILAVFFHHTMLPKANLRVLESTAADWRAATSATPLAFNIQDVDKDTVVLYPPPATGSDAISGTFTSAFGSSFVTNQISVMYTESRTNVPLYLEPVIAFRALVSEFTRDSDHFDQPTAQAAQTLADIFFQMAVVGDAGKELTSH